MRYLILTILLFTLTGCGNQVDLGVSIEDEINIEKEIRKLEQEQEKKENGKYKYIKQYERNGIKYKVNEYDAPPYNDNSKGYCILIEGEGFKRNECIGVEKEHREFNYTWEAKVDCDSETYIASST